MNIVTCGRVPPVPIDTRVDGPEIWLPESVAAETEDLLRSYGGTEDHEGIVYWGGAEATGGAVALTAISPSAVTTWGSFQTDADANTEIVSLLSRLGLSLIAQVHSHPGDWVDHSDGDDAGALVRFPGFWSLVVPRFARHGFRPLNRCGVHLFQSGEFRRLTEEAVSAQVHLVPAAVDLRREVL